MDESAQDSDTLGEAQRPVQRGSFTHERDDAVCGTSWLADEPSSQIETAALDAVEVARTEVRNDRGRLEAERPESGCVGGEE